MLRNVPSTTNLRRRLKTDWTVTSPLLESTNVGMHVFKNVSKPANTNKNWILMYIWEKNCEISFLWKLLKCDTKQMDSRHSNAKTVLQDPMCWKHSQGKAIDIKDTISVKLLQESRINLKLRIRSFCFQRICLTLLLHEILLLKNRHRKSHNLNNPPTQPPYRGGM